MAGWLTRYFSKLLKAPFILRWEMRGEGRKIYHILRIMKLKIYEDIPEKVLKQHRVSAAIRDQFIVNKDAKKVEELEYELGFNEQVEESLTLKEVKEIEAILLKHEREHGETGYERDFGEKIVKIIGNAHGEDRKVYFTYVEPIIKVAEKPDYNKTLMEQIRLLGSKRTNILAALALRIEIRIASKGLKKLKRDELKIRQALENWDRAKGNKEMQEAHIRNALFEIERVIETDLHNDTLIAKRDFLLTLLSLKYIEDDEKFMREYYRDNVMPRVPELERIKKLEEVKKHMVEHMHVLAQGLRRILSAEEDAQKLAETLIVSSHQKKP